MSDLRLASRIRRFTPEREPQPLTPTGGGLQFEPQLSGNVQVQGDVPAALAEAGATNVLGSTPSFVDQFLNPELSSEQQQALDAFRKTAIGRGLSGAGLQSQLRATENRLLAGQKLGALRNLIGDIQARAGAFRGQVSGFLSPDLRSRTAQGDPFARQAISESLLGGLTSLGFGDVARGELFRRVAGEQGRVIGLGGADLESLSRDVSQIFNPRLTAEQINLPASSNLARTLEGFRVRGLDPAILNRNVATARLLSTLRGGLQTLQGGLAGLSVTGLGGSLASPESILNADLGSFQDLLGLFNQPR